MRHIFSIAGTKTQFEAKTDSRTVMGQEKKRHRLAMSEKFPEKYIPLHAVLLKNKDCGILISGPSGSGKSVIAQELTKVGFKILANDFVACWVKSNKIFAGDLNYLDLNKSKEAVKINHLVCLDTFDRRDRFISLLSEFKFFYQHSLDGVDIGKVYDFTRKPVFKKLYKIHFFIGNRQNIKRSTTSLLQIIEKNISYKKVGIVGLGTIGQALSNLIVNEEWLSELHLYTKTYNKLLGLKMDLESTGSKTRIIIHKSLGKIIQDVDLLVLCFNIKDESTSNIGGERLRKIFPHALYVKKIATFIRQANFKGKVLMVTNPVDLLSWALYSFSNLSSKKFDWKGIFSDQIFGIGLGLDYQRLKILENKSAGDLEILGEHGEHQFLAKKYGNHLKFHSDVKVLRKVKNYSPNIRKHIERTVFGPSHEIVNVLRALVYSKDIARISTMMKDGNFVGNIVNIKNGVVADKYKFNNKILKALNFYFDETSHIKGELISMHK